MVVFNLGQNSGKWMDFCSLCRWSDGRRRAGVINKQTHTSPSLNWYPPALNVSTRDLVPRSRNLQILLTFQQSQIFTVNKICSRSPAQESPGRDCFESGMFFISSDSDIKISPLHFWGQRETWHQRIMASTIEFWDDVVGLVVVVRMGPIKILSSLVWRITLVNTASPSRARAPACDGLACLDLGPASLQLSLGRGCWEMVCRFPCLVVGPAWSVSWYNDPRGTDLGLETAAWLAIQWQSGLIPTLLKEGSYPHSLSLSLEELKLQEKCQVERREPCPALQILLTWTGCPLSCLHSRVKEFYQLK